jgi:hypothetical protein
MARAKAKARRGLLDVVAEALREADVDAVLKLGHGPSPDQLLVALQADQRGRVLHLQIMVLEGMGDLPVLQYFVGLPYRVSPGTEIDLCRTICATNPNVPLTGFELSEAQATLFFRYNQCVATDPLELSVIGWTIAMIEVIISRFGPLLEEVGEGLPFLDARQRLVADIAVLVDEGSPPGSPEGTR